MLETRLSSEVAAQLSHLARQSGRAESDMAGDWIVERLLREQMHEKIGKFADLGIEERHELARWAAGEATDAWLRALDAEDGGYDWGSDGPPQDARPVSKEAGQRGRHAD